MWVQNSDPAATEFADTLLAISNGRAPYTSQVQVPPDWCIDTNDTVSLINAIYPSIHNPDPQPHDYHSQAILAAKNIDVDIINDTAFSLFPGTTHMYNSNDTIINHDDPDGAAANYLIEFLNSIM